MNEASRTSSPAAAEVHPLPPITGWDDLVTGQAQQAFCQALAAALPTKRWFGSKTRTIVQLRIDDALAVTATDRLLVTRIRYAQGEDEIYLLALGLVAGEQAERLAQQRPESIWLSVPLAGTNEIAVVHEALHDEAFCTALLACWERPEAIAGQHGQLVATRCEPFAALRGPLDQPLAAKIVRAEQSNSSIIYEERLILKMFRRVETGTNPDLEINQHLTQLRFANTAPLAGSLEYRRGDQSAWSLAVLQGFIPNQGDAWSYLLGRLHPWLEEKLKDGATADDVLALLPPPGETLMAAAQRGIPQPVNQAMGAFIADAAKLGRRTAEMHCALATPTDNANFAPEAFTAADFHDFASRCRQLTQDTFALIRQQLPQLSDADRQKAEALLRGLPAAQERFVDLENEKAEVAKIRCHGDYHLGQVLVTADDFVIIDFEGEPSRSLAERRKKLLAARDVAGMIRSFHYASCTAATHAKQTAPHAALQAEAWTQAWFHGMGVAFLRAYLELATGTVFVPAAIAVQERLLDACLLEKAIYELRYELNNRPDWVYLPLTALLQLLGIGTLDIDSGG